MKTHGFPGTNDYALETMAGTVSVTLGGTASIQYVAVNLDFSWQGH